MELILYVEKGSADKLREILLKDDVVSRANVLFRDAKSLGKDGYYVRVLGSEEQCKKALELAKDLAEEVSGEEREKILKMLESEDEEMLSGFSVPAPDMAGILHDMPIIAPNDGSVTETAIEEYFRSSRSMSNSPIQYLQILFKL